MQRDVLLRASVCLFVCVVVTLSGVCMKSLGDAKLCMVAGENRLDGCCCAPPPNAGDMSGEKKEEGADGRDLSGVRLGSESTAAAPSFESTPSTNFDCDVSECDRTAVDADEDEEDMEEAAAAAATACAAPSSTLGANGLKGMDGATRPKWPTATASSNGGGGGVGEDKM